MTRIVNAAAAQMGPISRSETRKDTVRRLIALMREAKARGSDLVVFTELALTTFFPRWVIEDEAELDSFYEKEMPGPETQPLFDEAKRLEIGFYLGYAELAEEGGRKRRFNTSILVDRSGRIVGKYRKVHLPGHKEPQPGRKHQHLEKRYFEPGDLGFGVWRAFDGVMGMCICNDRRWPETYRVMGLQGVEMVMLGYNTPYDHTGHDDIDSLTQFHNHLSMQAGAYQNSTWVIGTAKCGTEEGSKMVGQSVIVAPSGEIVAMACTIEDEIITARCDLDMGKRYRETIFDFARHREPDAYRLIVERKGAVPPPQ
ncbi:N-carbamoyl-D-amino-acid hydrolase [Chelativorans sp. J32]|uniref:N-carbamyl-D-amino acid amidohydrolase n=1 Tax=Pseudomonas sp. KNK003A TaxID=252129 RepID=Q76N51_9PSED|nr:N-carbamoyl-D-amino-acid hydrolase [Chelativorans sp. J32]BAD00008.1 N-carbamyl-D-amino acid amidohydrolase [Pseudomonas sp. KNK003A]